MQLFVRFVLDVRGDPDELVDRLSDDLEAPTSGLADVVGVTCSVDGSGIAIIETGNRERVEPVVREVIAGYQPVGEVTVSLQPPEPDVAL